MEEKTVAGIEKLVDVVASGIGSIAGPMLAPWRARKETEARAIEAEGSAKVLRIHAQAQADARRLLGAEGSSVKGEIELQEGIRQRIEYQEHKRQANIVTVVDDAAQRLEGAIVPAVEPNHDWTAKFFREVQDVSSEEMQVLWTKVLEGEVREPGTTSMRTLGILKDLNEVTARLFSRFCSAAVYLKGRDGGIFDARVSSLGGNAAQNAIAKYGFGFGTLNLLNEHGLIISDYNSYDTYVVNADSADSGEFTLHHQGVSWDWIIARQDVNKKTVKLHGVAMTVAGVELSQVVAPEPMTEYTEALGAFLLNNFGLEMKPTEVAATPHRGMDLGIRQ